MLRSALACSLVLALAAPAAAAEEVGGSALDLRLRAMLNVAGPGKPAAAATLAPPKDPRVAAAWSAGPPLAMLLLGLGATALGNAQNDAWYADQNARGIAPVDQGSPPTPFYAPLLLLPVATPVAFGGGQFYAGDPLRGTLVTLGGPVATLGGFLAGVVVGGLIPNPTPAPGQVPQNLGLQRAMYGGIAGCTAYGLWAAWDAYKLVEARNAAAPAP